MYQPDPFDDPLWFDAIQYGTWTVRAVYETGRDTLSGLDYATAYNWHQDMIADEDSEFISGLIRVEIFPELPA